MSMQEKELAAVRPAGGTMKGRELAKGRRALDLILRFDTVIIFFALLIYSIFRSEAFLTQMNIFNLLRQNAGAMMLAMGMLIVVLTGGIDLSVGAQSALSAVLCAHFMVFLKMPVPVAVLCTLGCNLAIGLLEGYFVAYRKMAPFVVTLAFMSIASGVAYTVSKGTPIRIKSPFMLSFGADGFLSVPYPVWLAAAAVLVVILILRFTVYGRFIKAIGSNESAVRLSGIQVNLYKASAYMVSSLFCSLAGITTMARSILGSAQIGTGWETDAIAAVVIGGASLAGGKGTAINTVLGVLILAMIGNIMKLMNIHAYQQQIIKGCIILAAVLLHGLRSDSK